MTELKYFFRKALSKHAFQDNFLGSLGAFWYRKENSEIQFHSSRAPSYFAGLAQNTLWSRYSQQTVPVHCKQAELKTSSAFVFQGYNSQQVLKKQPAIVCVPNLFFNCVRQFRSQKCLKQTSPYRPYLYLLSRHTRDFWLSSFPVFEPVFYDQRNLPLFSHIQCLSRPL